MISSVCLFLHLNVQILWSHYSIKLDFKPWTLIMRTGELLIKRKELMFQGYLYKPNLLNRTRYPKCGKHQKWWKYQENTRKGGKYQERWEIPGKMVAWERWSLVTGLKTWWGWQNWPETVRNNQVQSVLVMRPSKGKATCVASPKTGSTGCSKKQRWQ